MDGNIFRGKISPLVVPPSPKTMEHGRTEPTILYQRYKELRDGGFEKGMDPGILQEIDSIREEFASLAMRTIQFASSWPEARGKLEHIVDQALGTIESEHHDLGAYLFPVSTTHDYLQTRSPIHAIRSTEKILDIANRYAEVLLQESDGVLFTGSSNWGGSYATKGAFPKTILTNSHPLAELPVSDIDFLILAADQGQLANIVDKLARLQMIDDNDRRRLDIYHNFTERGEAQIFSLRPHCDNTMVSLDIVSHETLSMVSECEEKRDPETGVGYLWMFRPNVSANFRRTGGYPLRSMLGPADELSFSPDHSPVDPDHSELGYLSRLPTGGFVRRAGEERFYMGLFDSFLLVAPSILYDPKQSLTQSTARLKTKLRAFLHGRLPDFIPRQERMANGVLARIRQDLSQSSTLL